VVFRRIGDFVQTSVINQGPGIPRKEIPYLFTRFQRAKRGKLGDIPGIGLGLYITRGLIEAHGGRIWVESVPEKTTTFHFTLPIAEQVSKGA
ncbi:MAG: sensor histidine kinase, partial [Chloroflexota bacterium]